MTRTEPNFNLIAKPYRCLEYLTLGKALEDCRAHYLPQLLHHSPARRHALVLGDGDGRFIAQLLFHNPHLDANAIDTSATMLDLLRKRCESATPNINKRLRTHRANALTIPLEGPYDLVVTHFFLDCLTQPELESLITRIVPTLTPRALWLISDFRVPTGPLRLPAQLFIRSLYLAFRILTGLRTTHLPNYTTPLARAGLTRIAHQRRLGGLLVTELWQT